MRKLEKLKEKLTYHVVDSTALLIESTPVYALFEKGVAKMSDDMSINARIFAGGLCFLGMGWLYSQGRDLSKKIFKITDKTKEKIQGAHDVAYNAVFNLALAPPIYAVSQVLAKEDLDLTKIAVGTGIAMILGAVNGAPQGYVVDTFRDLVGLKSCERKTYPKIIKKRSSKFKKSLAGGLAIATIGLTGLIYSLTPDNKPQQNLQTRPAIEQTSNYQNDSLENLVV
ncbi:MAG: hypothetical protein KJ721_01500 [Nanoarchaeota archaeon]|nr:hypothetical protein [Nanoarchaeota archaeon]